VSWLLSSHLAIIVLTINQVFVAISLIFTGSPIHPPLGALTFAQLLSKNASKKTVPRDRLTKKPRSLAKTKRPNKTAQKATRQASPVHPMRTGYFPPVYSSSIYCPTQIWNGMTMNPWYMYSPFVYPGWGAPPFYSF
jgi:hypothetical protein